MECRPKFVHSEGVRHWECLLAFHCRVSWRFSVTFGVTVPKEECYLLRKKITTSLREAIAVWCLSFFLKQRVLFLDQVLGFTADQKNIIFLG